MTHLEVKLIDIPVQWVNERIFAALYTLTQGEQLATDFWLALECTVSYLMTRISSKGKDPVHVKIVHTSRRRNTLSSKLLARRWGTQLATAKRTMDATTQHGVCSILNPTMTRMYRTNDQQLCYFRLLQDIFTDRLKASVHSWFCQKRYA